MNLSLAAFAIFACAPAFAQTAAPAPAKPWKDSAEFSFVDANGNSQAVTTSARDIFSLVIDTPTRLDIGGGGLGSRSAGKVTAEQYFAEEKLQRLYDPEDYGFEKYRWDKNRFAGVISRQEFSLGVGRDLWKTPADLLTGEVSPTYVNEVRIGSPRRSFAASRLYSKYGHSFSPTAKFSQDFEYLQSLADKRDSRFNTETDLTTTLTSIFSIKTSFVWHHSGQPPPGFIKDDTLTAVALIANF